MSILVNCYLAKSLEWILTSWSVCSIMQRTWGLATAGWDRNPLLEEHSLLGLQGWT